MSTETQDGMRRRRPRRTGNAVSRAHFPPADVDPSPSRQRFLAIHRVLRERIALLVYPPGTRLDVDRLAAEFEVSRTPIRSVLQRLEYQGLVVARHGVGTRVAEVDFQRLRDAMLLRMRLAELIGELSPRSPGPEALAAVAEAADMCRALGPDPDPQGFGRVDIRLHDGICALIGHSMMLQVYDELFYATARMWCFFLPKLDWAEEKALFLADIEATRRAIAQGDSRGAGLLVRNALSAAVIRLSDLLRAHEGGGGRVDR